MSTLIRHVLGPIAALFLSAFGVTAAGANTIESAATDIPLYFTIPASIDLNFDNVDDFTVALEPLGGSTLIGHGSLNLSLTSGNVTRFGPDVLIGPSLNFSSAGGIDTGTWVSAGGGYFGFNFQHNDTTAYGWAHILITGGGAGASITGWAFDTSGASILTGATVSAVPEPSTYAAILGACALGFVAWRKHRRPRSHP
jgi:hypothetical protein